MKKLMLIYYNIVAVLTILYLVLTATLMNLGNAFITTQGWHVVILSVLILVIVFGMEFAKKKFPDDFFEFIIENAGLLCIAWLTLVVRAFGVTVLKHAADLALDEWMQQVIQRAGIVQVGIFAITNGIVVAKIIRYFVRKKAIANNE
ncbi:MAG: hypothetical protein HXO95_02065 [Streptococcus sp.]|jgi:hypothetical protein|nr:hypothetical protein [Streptococcus sp.]